MNIPSELLHWQILFEKKARILYPPSDPAHDFLHIKRVVKTALHLCELEKAKASVVLPAAYFHDFINVSKNDPRRSQASRLSSIATIEYLREIKYPYSHEFEEIAHAIEAHSFSAGIQPLTIEAKIVQDSDRLDSLGAIGVARCFSTAGVLHRPFYHENDPWAEERPYDDLKFTLDHFFVKLIHLPKTLQTASGVQEGILRLKFLESFVTELQREIPDLHEQTETKKN